MTPKVRASAKSRRWSLRIALLQNALRAREALHRAEEALDNITRILFEEEEAPIDSDPPAKLPSLPPLPADVTEDIGPPSRPSTKPTVYQQALRGDALMELLLKRWSEANSEDKRDAVRDIAQRCLATNAITATEYADLQKKLR